SVSASDQSTALWTSSRLDVVRSDLICWASPSRSSDTNADEPNTTIRVSGGECSINRLAADSVASLGLSLGLATLLANPPLTATARTWWPFLSAAASFGPGNP